MAKQRDAIRMTDQEVEEFLDSSRTLIVATLDKKGHPHQTALWFTRYDGLVIFETYGNSQKVVNLRRDPRIAVLCEQGETYDQLRGVSIKGKAEIIENGPRLEELMTILVKKNAPGQSPGALAKHVAAMIQKRVIVVVHPQNVISWDHRKLKMG